jgi:16S rRNA (cytidine1402-2'-O)-methyltransferase
LAKLVVIATPIGNLEDITLRALRMLGEVDALACEDTRRTRILFAKNGIASPRTLFSYREANEAHAASRTVGFLKEGLTVGVCSDAGYPGISDAGYRLISRAIEEGFQVEVIPGAGSVEPALLYSGLPTSSFTFKGFAPRKPGPRQRFLEQEKDLPHTLIFYESPFRVPTLLQDALQVYGDRKAAVCIELTKKFERVHRGTLSELCAQFRDRQIKGEVTVVVAGNNPKFLGSGDQPRMDEPDIDQDEDPDSDPSDETDTDPVV